MALCCRIWMPCFHYGVAFQRLSPFDCLIVGLKSSESELESEYDDCGELFLLEMRCGASDLSSELGLVVIGSAAMAFLCMIGARMEVFPDEYLFILLKEGDKV